MSLVTLQAYLVRALSGPALSALRHDRGFTSVTNLYYHDFTASRPSSFLEVKQTTVDSHLEVLSQRFTLMSLSDCVRQLAKQGHIDQDKPPTTISIDDALASFERVLPYFEKRGVPVTLFVPVGLCLGRDILDGLRSWCLRYYTELAGEVRAGIYGNAEEFFQIVMSADAPTLGSLEKKLSRMPRKADPFVNRPMYSFDQLRKLSQHPLITVSSHSMSHQRIGTLPARWRDWEIMSACHYISELQGDRKMFAYPYGLPEALDSEGLATMKRAGIEYAFTCCPARIRSSSPNLILGRSCLMDCVKEQYVWGVAAGALEWYHVARHPRCPCRAKPLPSLSGLQASIWAHRS